ncbi:retrotransposon protein, putative, ty1-copia subclass [Tanacetum coccineum]
MLDLESNKWIDAMNAEIQTMMDNYGYGSWLDLPHGFVDPNHPRKVCKLQSSIYGLKQASRSWNKRFDEEIKMFGFSQNLDEPCVYQKASGSNLTFLILYVDDIIIMGNHIPSLQSVNNYLGKCFSIKDLGEAAFILGIKIYRDRSKRLIGIGQNAYMDKILKRYKMDNSKRGHIPMQERLDLNKSQGAQTPKEVNRMKNVPYASAVGSIMYAVRCTRPDVAFAQNMTSRFQQNPGELHWTAVKNILNSKQSTTAMSAIEYEYIAASEAAKKAVWIMKFISGLGARHYQRRYHYVRECVELGEIRILKVHTDNNLADPFTKALSNRKLTQHARGMGLRPARSANGHSEVDELGEHNASKDNNNIEAQSSFQGLQIDLEAVQKLMEREDTWIFAREIAQ